MWKYVTRRFRDTLERGANDLGRCSTTLVNNGAVNNNDEINECPPGPSSKWLSLRKTKSHLNDNSTNGPKWSCEHRDRNWMGAITWENGSNKLHDNNEKNSGPPCKWLLHKNSEFQQSENATNDMKWSFEHVETYTSAKPGRCMKKIKENSERNAGSPHKFRLFRRCKSLEKDNGRNDKKWTDQHRCTDTKTSENCVNTFDHKNAKPPSMWMSLRRYCKRFDNGDGTNGKKWSFHHLNRTWLDAITWSGVAVFGWYTSQLIHFKLKQHCRLHERKCLPVNNLLSTIYPYIVTDTNKNDFHMDSVSKIGKVFSHFTPTVYLMANDPSESFKINDNVLGNVTGNASGQISSNRSGNSAQTQSHNPTNAQSTDTSDDDLAGVLNSIENRLGLASIENGQYQDGLSLLRSAAERNHPPALYNLGLCYEKGLGVTPNEKTAMELYRSAAAMDHPEALYNLGIFYGQGRGGLKADQETAVRLLRLAAVQGQKDAIDALKYLDVSISEPRHKDVNSWTYKEHTQFSSSQNIVPTQSKLFVDNVNFLQATV